MLPLKPLHNIVHVTNKHLSPNVCGPISTSISLIFSYFQIWTVWPENPKYSSMELAVIWTFELLAPFMLHQPYHSCVIRRSEGVSMPPGWQRMKDILSPARPPTPPADMADQPVNHIKIHNSKTPGPIWLKFLHNVRNTHGQILSTRQYPIPYVGWENPHFIPASEAAARWHPCRPMWPKIRHQIYQPTKVQSNKNATHKKRVVYTFAVHHWSFKK